jgi:hypothetical protein
MPDLAAGTHQSLRPSTNRYDVGLVQSRLDENPTTKRMLFKVLDLVDRYWNGSKSLHQHAKFLGKWQVNERLYSNYLPLQTTFQVHRSNEQSLID